MNSYNAYYQNIRMSYSNGSYFIPMSDLGNGPASYGREWTTKPRYRPGQVVRTKTRQRYIHLPGGGPEEEDGGEEEEGVTEGDDESVARWANAAYSDDDVEGEDEGEEEESESESESESEDEDESESSESESYYSGEDPAIRRIAQSQRDGVGRAEDTEPRDTDVVSPLSEDSKMSFPTDGDQMTEKNPEELMTEKHLEKEKRTSGLIYEDAIRGKYPSLSPAGKSMTPAKLQTIGRIQAIVEARGNGQRYADQLISEAVNDGEGGQKTTAELRKIVQALEEQDVRFEEEVRRHLVEQFNAEADEAVFSDSDPREDYSDNQRLIADWAAPLQATSDDDWDWTTSSRTANKPRVKKLVTDFQNSFKGDIGAAARALTPAKQSEFLKGLDTRKSEKTKMEHIGKTLNIAQKTSLKNTTAAAVKKALKAGK